MIRWCRLEFSCGDVEHTPRCSWLWIAYIRWCWCVFIHRESTIEIKGLPMMSRVMSDQLTNCGLVSSLSVDWPPRTPRISQYVKGDSTAARSGYFGSPSAALQQEFTLVPVLFLIIYYYVTVSSTPLTSDIRLWVCQWVWTRLYINKIVYCTP